jgi:hypothetical protein
MFVVVRLVLLSEVKHVVKALKMVPESVFPDKDPNIRQEQLSPEAESVGKTDSGANQV